VLLSQRIGREALILNETQLRTVSEERLEIAPVAARSQHHHRRMILRRQRRGNGKAI
jgi:hypothetical protein